ncbi:MAG: thioredoxin family protein [Alteraurantiacibacter sp.]
MIRAFALAATLALSACTTMHNYPEATPYDESADAMAEVDAALASAAIEDKRVLLVMGANWCHDSRALAGWLKTPRFSALVDQYYVPVYVDAGVPQDGRSKNMDIARRFGVEELPGTPNLFVIMPDGRLVNRDTVTSWRDAESRGEDAIYDELLALATRQVGFTPVGGAEIAE